MKQASQYDCDPQARSHLEHVRRLCILTQSRSRNREGGSGACRRCFLANLHSTSLSVWTKEIKNAGNH
eukprot:15472806-Alexandrium_andersonii.AAC.1